MGISPTELSEHDVSETPEVVKQEIAGRSPVQIAVDRLKRDKIALLCLAVVVMFVLIAVFTTLITFSIYHWLVRSTFVGQFLNGKRIRGGWNTPPGAATPARLSADA